MKTIKEIAMELLLEGKHLNKGDFHKEYHTFTLTQRIEEIRRIDGWDVKSKPMPGRKGMVEYWLDQDEINRIHSHGSQVITQMLFATEKSEDEQLAEENRNLAEKASESLKSEDNAYFNEQLGIGLLGGHNY